MITIEDREPFDLGQGISVTPVLQSVPIWDDCAFIIQSPTETILDLNDLKIPAGRPRLGRRELRASTTC